jgi:hypothetical protein
MNLDKDLLALATEPAAGPRPQFFDDPAMDRVWDVLVALTTELAVTRTRMDSLERILAEHECLPAGVVDAWEADAEASAEQARAHQELLMRIFRGLVQENAAKA